MTEENEVQIDLAQSNDSVEIPLTESVNSSEIMLLLVNLFSNIDSVNKLKTSIVISDKSIDIINMLLKNSPQIFDDIGKNITNIMNDGILDVSDMPSIILLLKDFLNLNLQNNIKNLTVQDSILFIKDLLLILIEEKYIKVNDRKTVEKIIDSSIELLSSTINVNSSLYNSLLRLRCCKK